MYIRTELEFYVLILTIKTVDLRLHNCHFTCVITLNCPPSSYYIQYAFFCFSYAHLIGLSKIKVHSISFGV